MVDDLHRWLEDEDSSEVAEWVAQERRRAAAELGASRWHDGFVAEAVAMAAADDRIPMPEQHFGRIYNLWRDVEHPHGVWRWTSREQYGEAEPGWTPVLDLDALGAFEGKEWVWKGAVCLAGDERFCLVGLSEGGEDAVTYREMDLVSGSFVEGGFELPRGKQQVTWLDPDTLWVARDWGPGTVTRSGYPFVIKEVRRGQPLAQAREVFRGESSDGRRSASAVHLDQDGARLVLVSRGVSFFRTQQHIQTAGGWVELDVPAKVAVVGLVAGHVVFHCKEPWGEVPAGAVATAPLAQVEAGAPIGQALFAPGPRQSVSEVVTTPTRVVATVYDNVSGQALVWSRDGDGWTRSALALPDHSTVLITSRSSAEDVLHLLVTGFLQPTSIWRAELGSGRTTKVKALPERFDAGGHTVTQFHATSADGTEIPYFVVHPTGTAWDATTATIMTAYGGFGASMTPFYSAVTGRLWLERGGAFVVANIRGGGEFGPAWHEAGRKTGRQRVYDDFIAVGEDLIRRRLTSPDRLGIYGGSNGGLLMGVVLNQRPELWGAVVIQVPLLDMLRYEKIAAGASWVDEYGSVEDPLERAFLQQISPYHNVPADPDAYPAPFIWTTTKDDRVGPQHARKFAARLGQHQLDYLYLEADGGGHTGDGDLTQAARLQALQMTYFAEKLMLPPAHVAV